MLAGLPASPALYLLPLAAGLLIGVLQILISFLGHLPLSNGLEQALDGTSVGEGLDWLNIGRVPLALLLMLLLVTFGIVGVVLTGLMPSIPAWVFIAAAAPAAVIVTKLVGDAIARVVPRDESYAVTADEFVGLEGTVTLGPLDDGPAGNVLVRDRHGETHTLRARPVDPGTVIEQGSSVVVVARDEGHKGRVFHVMPFSA